MPPVSVEDMSRASYRATERNQACEGVGWRKESSSPWQPGCPPLVELMAPAGQLQGLPEDILFGLVFLWGWQSEPMLCLFHLGEKNSGYLN